MPKRVPSMAHTSRCPKEPRPSISGACLSSALLIRFTNDCAHQRRRLVFHTLHRDRSFEFDPCTALQALGLEFRIRKRLIISRIRRRERSLRKERETSFRASAGNDRTHEDWRHSFNDSRTSNKSPHQSTDQSPSHDKPVDQRASLSIIDTISRSLRVQARSIPSLRLANYLERVLVAVLGSARMSCFIGHCIVCNPIKFAGAELELE